MPSASKNEKAKGASATATSRRSSGSATKAATKAGRPDARTSQATSAAKPGNEQSSRTKPAARAAAPKLAPEKASAARTAALETSAKPTVKSALKTAKAAIKTSAKAPVTTESKGDQAGKTTKTTARAPARPDLAAKRAPARSGAVAQATTAKAKGAAGKVSTAKTKAVAAKAARSPSVSGEVKRDAKPLVAATPVVREPAKAASPAIAKAAPAPAPAAKPTAAQEARGASPPFPAAASASAGKTSPTPTAGEDKKLAKRNEHPVTTATPVAVEKTSFETRAAPKAAAAPAPVKAKPAGSKHGFKLNEFIVYPAHGVGQIVGMETQEVAGFSLELFVVSFIKDKMILKVPTSKVANVGMRKLAETNVVDKALSTLSGRARVKRTMWSRRAQEYEAKINSGDLVTIAEVVRDLYRSDTQPEQSYSERQLYEAALDRMAREVAAVRKLLDSEALKLIESFLQKGPRRGQKTDDVADADETDEEDVDRAA